MSAKCHKRTHIYGTGGLAYGRVDANAVLNSVAGTNFNVGGFGHQASCFDVLQQAMHGRSRRQLVFHERVGWASAERLGVNIR
jgi:hypothetical protein